MIYFETGRSKWTMPSLNKTRDIKWTCLISKISSQSTAYDTNFSLYLKKSSIFWSDFMYAYNKLNLILLRFMYAYNKLPISTRVLYKFMMLFVSINHECHHNHKFHSSNPVARREQESMQPTRMCEKPRSNSHNVQTTPSNLNMPSSRKTADQLSLTKQNCFQLRKVKIRDNKIIIMVSNPITSIRLCPYKECNLNNL